MIAIMLILVVITVIKATVMNGRFTSQTAGTQI